MTKKTWEKVYPFSLSVIISIVIFYFLKEKAEEKLFSEKFVELIFTTSGILGSFLLAILALLLQANNKSIEHIKKYGRFRELVNYNEQAVFLSFFCMIFSGIFMIGDFKEIYFFSIKGIQIGFKHVLIYSVLLMLTATYRYIDIFYTLIKN